MVFDEEFVGGRALGGHVSQFRGRLCPWHALLRVSTDEQAAQVGSTGRGEASATKPSPQFNPGEAVKAANKARGKGAADGTAAAAAAAPARDGHVMGMHPVPVPHLAKKAAGPITPGSMQELSLLHKDLIVNRAAAVPVSYATGPPPQRQPKKVVAAQTVVPPSDLKQEPNNKAAAGGSVAAPVAAAGEGASDGRRLLALLQQQLKISPADGSETAAAAAAAVPAAAATSSAATPLPADAREVGKVSITMGGFRILRSAAGLPHPPSPAQTAAAAPPAEPEPAPAPTPVVSKPLSDGAQSGRAALAFAAGLTDLSLPPLPPAPLEHELAGVIQVPAGHKSLVNPGAPAAATAAAPLQARGFFSAGSGGPQGGARLPSPLKPRAASPAKTKPVAPSAEAPAAASAASAAAPTTSLAEKLAKAKAAMLKRKEDAAADAGDSVVAGEKEAVAVAAAVGAVEVPTGGAPDVSAAPAEAATKTEKRLVPLNQLLKKHK